MLERGGRARFRLEARGELLFGNLQRDRAIEAGVSGFVDVTLPPAPIWPDISYAPSRVPGAKGIACTF